MKMTLAMWSGRLPLGTHPKDVRAGTQAGVHTHVHSRIHDSQKVETPKCPLMDEWMKCGLYKQWNGIQP